MSINSVDFAEIERQERERRMAWEAATIATAQGETIAQLRDAFEAVCDKQNWKAPWAAYVPSQAVGIVCRAVEFFCADRPEIVGIQPLTGKVLLEGRGYMAD